MRELAMLTTILTIGIATLLTAALMLALLVIADSAIKAQQAYRQLTREGALMRAGFSVQVEARDMRVRRAPARAKLTQRPLAARQLAVRPVPFCAA
jgi:hypothetical protein